MSSNLATPTKDQDLSRLSDTSGASVTKVTSPKSIQLRVGEVPARSKTGVSNSSLVTLIPLAIERFANPLDHHAVKTPSGKVEFSPAPESFAAPEPPMHPV